MTTIVKWWPHDRPIPKGWRVVTSRLSHHSKYSFLIEPIPPKGRRKGRGGKG